MLDSIALEQLAGHLPVSSTLWAHWLTNAGQTIPAMRKFLNANGNLWAVVGDLNHFAQFATDSDRVAMQAISDLDRFLINPVLWEENYLSSHEDGGF